MVDETINGDRSTNTFGDDLRDLGNSLSLTEPSFDTITDLDRCCGLGRFAVDLDVASSARGSSVCSRLGQPD